MATDDFDEVNEESLLRNAKFRVRWTGAETKAGQPSKAARRLLRVTIIAYSRFLVPVADSV